VQASVQRGLTLDEAKAQVALSNQTAGLTAGYMSQLGLAGLGYSNQAILQNTAEANQQLGFMNSVMMPYPNAGMYGQLAQGYGALQAANAANARLGMRSGSGALPYGQTGMTFPNDIFSNTIQAQSGAGGGYTPQTYNGQVAPYPSYTSGIYNQAPSNEYSGGMDEYTGGLDMGAYS
jgi:hypothetical protein